MIITAGGAVILSPTDLIDASSCEYGYLRSVDVRLGRLTATPKADAMRDRLVALGRDHEARVDEVLRDRHETFVRIGRPSRAVEAIQAAAESTRRHVDAGVEVIAQATLFDGRLYGIADYLIRQPDGSYAVWEAKSGTNVHESYVIQLAAYAGLVDHAMISRSAVGGMFLRDREQPHDLTDDELAPVRDLLARVQTITAARVSASTVADWADDTTARCGRCDHCAAAIDQTDDVWKVFNIRAADRTKLRAAGIVTMAQLAESCGVVDGVKPETVARLRAQAAMQVQHSVDAGGRAVVAYEVFDPSALNALPPPDHGDLFFDFEGDTMHVDADGSFALEYLWGISTSDGTYVHWWADDRAQERVALSDFLDFVADRRAEHPSMHVYHYGTYETSRLTSLSAKVHGHRADEVESLLADGLFVDLHKVVTRSVRVSASSYGLKALEPLFRPARENDAVANAVDSIAAYADYCAARDGGDVAAAGRSRKAVVDYNADDCESTRLLRDWLHARR